MGRELSRLNRIQRGIHSLALGMTLGLGTMFLGQGCNGAGQCPACGACVSRLAILTLPFLASGVTMLAGKVWSSFQHRKWNRVEGGGGSCSAFSVIETEDQASSLSTACASKTPSHASKPVFFKSYTQ